MSKSYRLVFCVLAFCCLAILPAVAAQKGAKKADKGKNRKAMSTSSDVKIPDLVQTTLDAKFPNAAVEKAESAMQGGVTVWKIDFREGKNNKTTDIAENGTMLQYAVAVNSKYIPNQAKRPIEKSTPEGAKAGRAQRIEITYETKDGKVVKLKKPATHYSVEMTKGDETAKIIVDSNGKVVLEPKWQPAKTKETKSAA